jgi:hypothetical protein
MIRIIALILFFPLSSIAQQRINLTLFGGLANYTGDLQEKRFAVDQAGGTLGAGLSYQLYPKFLIRGQLQYAKIGADDKKSTAPLAISRNLNFKSPIIEASLLADYSFLDLEKKKFTPYVFVGIALFHFNPYTHDSTGAKYYLHDLGTEGQGLASNPGKKPYNLSQLSLPFGGGVRFRINTNTILGYEIGLRKTGTDYLDDVSDHYVNEADLLAGHGPKAVELSYRGDELKDGLTQYPNGQVRGGPKFKDWYYFQGITLSIGIFDGEGKIFGKSPYGRVDCPKSVL